MQPYPDREAIDYKKVIEGKAEVLGYVSDPVEVFFLHIQGSGQLEFEGRYAAPGGLRLQPTASPTAPSARCS